MKDLDKLVATVKSARDLITTKPNAEAGTKSGTNGRPGTNRDGDVRLPPLTVSYRRLTA